MYASMYAVHLGVCNRWFLCATLSLPHVDKLERVRWVARVNFPDPRRMSSLHVQSYLTVQLPFCLHLKTLYSV